MNNRFHKLCRHLALLALVAFVFSYAPEVYANTFTVNSTADMVDASPGNGKCETGRDAPGVTPAAKECTLRAAVQESNALAGKHEITLPAGTYLLSQLTQCSFSIRETTSAQNDTSTALCMTGQMTITGAGANSTFIDGGGLNRVAFLDSRAVVEIRSATIRKGALLDAYRGWFVAGGGGGIHNRGTLTLTETIVSENVSNFGGGGIHNVGTLTLDRSTVIGNSAVQNSGFGGGIDNGDARGCGDLNACDVIVNDSLITGNSSSMNGGGIGSYLGKVNITGSTISDNTSRSGGGILSISSVLSLTNSTLSNNSALSGGGLSVVRQAQVSQTTLNNVTITRNKGAQSGGGVRTTGDLTLKNTLIAGNTNENTSPTLASPDCETHFSTFISQGYNLIQDTRGCTITGDTTGNITGKNPLLGSLANNGGLTPTHALLPNSPALDAGNPNAPGSGGKACATADQRGLLRPVGQRCDIGAFEHKGGLSVSKATPNRGGNSGFVTTFISGSGFAEGADVRLRRAGQPDIIGAPVTVEVAGFSLSTSFDLSRKATGAWDIVVTNADGSSTTLSGGFTIEETKAPDLWSTIVGRSAVRVGIPAQYSIMYGNRGNVDAFNVPVTLSVPAKFKLFVFFDIAPPPAQAGQVATDWSQVSVVTLPATVSTNITLLLPVVPTGFTGTLRFMLLAPPEEQHGNEFLIFAAISKPYFKPELDQEILDGFVSGASSYVQRNLGVAIPPSLIPELKQYVTQQLQRTAASGRESLVNSLGTETEVYSLAQLTIDLAKFAAARAASPSATSSKVFVQSDSNSISSEVGAPASLVFLGKAGGEKRGGCGRVLAEGESCDDKPKPIPTPDKDNPPPKGLTPGECRDIPNHTVSADGERCIPKDTSACPNRLGSPFSTDPNCRTIPLRNSFDPNDKVGAPGALEKRFLQSATPFSYTVFFENLPTATAAAQVVTITDQLDVANLDLSTFSFGSISFDKYTVTPPPGQSEFVAALDLRPANNLIVKIDARLDRNTGLLTWHFTSLDPDTQQLTDDPDAGFLAPNRTSPEGEGSVTFFVSPKPGLATGSEIRNKARIVFDVNAPIDTPEWLNTIDDTKPVSGVLQLPAEQQTTSFEVKWSGTDTGAGVESYTIYVSENGGAYAVWQQDTFATSATFTGQTGKIYRFYSVARDAAGNREDAPPQADATTAIPAPSTLQFTLGNVSVSEGAGKITLTVRRAGALSQAATVLYETLSGTASELSDFNTTVGTLLFAAGEEEKTFEVLLTDDTIQESAETFTVRLTNASGATVGSTSTVTLTLADDDTAESSRRNMIDTVEGFVRQQYVDFLNREPDAAGLQFWTGILEGRLSSCGTQDTSEANTCRARARASVSEAFFVSVEFQATGYLVYRLYKASYAESAARPRGLPRYREFIRDAQGIGRGVVVNAPGWEQKLEANKQLFTREFVERSEFTARYPLSMTAEEFVAALLANAGLPPSGAERQAALAAYGSGGAEGRARAVRSIAESDAMFRREFNPAFVLMQYFGYLRRAPDEGEDAALDRQFGGYDFWLTKLNNESGDTTRLQTIDELLAPTKRAQMVEAFVVTGEYRRRFGPE